VADEEHAAAIRAMPTPMPARYIQRELGRIVCLLNILLLDPLISGPVLSMVPGLIGDTRGGGSWF